MRRDQLMEPDFLSEFLLFVIAAVMSFFLILTGVFCIVPKIAEGRKGTRQLPFLSAFVGCRTLRELFSLTFVI
jgi:hypothetical protein